MASDKGERGCKPPPPPWKMGTSSWHYSGQPPSPGLYGVGSKPGGLTVDGFGDTVLPMATLFCT